MLLLSLFGLFSIAQSKDCYCGDGNSYWQTSSNNCYSGFSNTKVYNIYGSWEVACRKCSKKAVEHMKNDGVTGKCFVCEKSITGMYLRVPPGKWDTAMKTHGDNWIAGSVNCRGTSMSNYGRSVSTSPSRAVNSKCAFDCTYYPATLGYDEDAERCYHECAGRRYIMGSRDFGGDIYTSRRQRQLEAQRLGAARLEAYRSTKAECEDECSWNPTHFQVCMKSCMGPTGSISLR